MLWYHWRALIQAKALHSKMSRTSRLFRYVISVNNDLGIWLIRYLGRRPWHVLLTRILQELSALLTLLLPLLVLLCNEEVGTTGTYRFTELA